jgi:hypothetical protein
MQDHRKGGIQAGTMPDEETQPIVGTGYQGAARAGHCVQLFQDGEVVAIIDSYRFGVSTECSGSVIPIHDERGQSMSVCISGDREGRYRSTENDEGIQGCSTLNERMLVDAPFTDS